MVKDRDKEAIKLQTQIINATSKLHSLGFRITCTYIPGAGWASEIVNNNTGENHELDEYDEKNTWEHLDKFDNSHECESNSKPRPFPGMEGKGIDGGTNE